MIILVCYTLTSPPRTPDGSGLLELAVEFSKLLDWSLATFVSGVQYRFQQGVGDPTERAVCLAALS